jgi:cytosine/adenosine deaminase-related metal-dependent hydrolase
MRFRQQGERAGLRNVGWSSVSCVGDDWCDTLQVLRWIDRIRNLRRYAERTRFGIAGVIGLTSATPIPRLGV